MKKIAIWVALTLAIYLIALLAQLPARYVVNELMPQYGIKLDRNWLLNDISGSIWSGEIGQLHYQEREIGKIRWNLHLLPLIVGDLALHWQHENRQGELQGEVVVDSGGEISAKEIVGEISVKALTALLPFVPFVANGTVIFDQLEIEMTQGKPHFLKGEIHWNQAEIIAMQKIDFGNISTKFSTETETGQIEARIHNRQGALAVNATAIVKTGGNYQLSGDLTARTEKDKPLLNNFIMLGRADKNGRLQFSQRGRL